MAEKTSVIVVGGGYAGVMAANRLTLREDVAVILINPRPTLVERLRLHQLVAGSHDAVVDYRKILADGVRLLVDTVTRIDAGKRRVELATGGTVGYDYLIYAVGSSSTRPDVPGAELAYPIATLEEAQQLRQVLNAAPTTAAVTVVGAGSTGIEVAAELGELGRSVTLICGELLGPYLHPRGRRAIAKQLAKLGVSVLDAPGTRVTAVTRDTVQLADGRVLPSHVTIWTAGFEVPNLAARSGLSTDAMGRLLTDETLTSVDDVRIVAAGDSAAPSDLPLRMSAQAARPLGAHAADTVLSRMTGKQPAQIDIGFFGQCIGLGRHSATVQLASRDDKANPFYIGGRLGGHVAAWIKETSIKRLVKELAHEGCKPGSFSWGFKDKKRQQLLRTKPADGMRQCLDHA